MSRPGSANRNAVAQGVVLLAVCVGGYVMAVDGPRKSLAEVQGEIDAVSAKLREAESFRDDVPRFAGAIERAGTEAKAIADAGRLARDERELFAALMALADGAGLRVEQLAPAKALERPRGRAPAGATPASDRDVVVTYSMTLTGSYEGLAAFLRGSRTGLGHGTVRSVRLTPMQDETATTVRAVIETEHYAFDASPAEPASLEQKGGA